MFEEMQSLTPFIVIAVYLIAELLKITIMKSDSKRTALPVVCAVIGGIIGLALYLFYPQGISADNMITAFTSGAFSGIATTGCNQIYKQIKKFRTDDGDENSDSSQG